MQAGKQGAPFLDLLLLLSIDLAACSDMVGHPDRHVFLVCSLALLVATTAAAAIDITQQQGRDGGVVVESSSPPSCEGKCGWWCVGGSCEAVLVPIEPPQEQQSRRHGSGGGSGDGSPSRASAAAHDHQQRPLVWYDGGHQPDYKPVAWTCKCVGAS